MKIFLRLLQFARPYRQYLPEYIAYVVPSIVFGALNFTLLIPLFDTLFNVQKNVNIASLPDFHFSLNYVKDLFNYSFEYLVVNFGKIVAMEVTCGIILLSVLMTNVFRYMSQRVLTRMRTRLVYRLRREVFEKLSRLHLGFFNKQQKGNILSVMSADVHEIESSIVSSIQTIFRDPLQLIIYFVLLFIVSAKLTMVTIVFFPISAYIIARISKSLRKSANKSQSLLGTILSNTEETISGIRIIKAFNAEKFVQKKFNSQNDSYRKVSKSLINRRELAGPLAEFLGTLVVVGVLLYGGRMVLNESSPLSASEFITYIILYSQIIPPIKNISNAVTTIQRGLAAGERALAIIDTPDEVVNSKGAEELSAFEVGIEYRDVSFAYDSENVLNHVSFKLPRGKMVALVGQSGSGKSTLADLLIRYYDTGSGSISIDDKDLREYTLESLRSKMGVVTQEPILFNDTVFNNIAFGNPDAKEEDVLKAAGIANVHEFVSQMEDGYQTNIGDRGTRLSGGQRQRISIARAVLKNPPILVLDEATSALDTESEKLVQEAIEHLMENRTTLVIAHRLSTIQHADEIIVLHQGEIAERGNHKQLIALNGIYKRLHEMQSFA